LQSVNSPEESFWLFRISFHYYTCMECIICITIGLIVSWFTRSREIVDFHLLTPIIRKFRSKNAPLENMMYCVASTVTCTCRTRTVDKSKSSGRTTVLTEDVPTRMEKSSKKSLRQLSQQTGTFK
ncbi:hypothetical protein ILUMI_00937, partial [Ignelater luminosus]